MADVESVDRPAALLEDVVASIQEVDHVSAGEAMQHQLTLTKPPGSLGRIEQLGSRLAAIAGSVPAASPEPAAVVVFAGDHGVHDEAVSPWPQEVTAQMVANFCGGGAAINVIADANDIEVMVVNAGVATELADHPRLLNRPIRPGTANLCRRPAMTRAEAEESVLLGVELAARLAADGVRCLLCGDMGIANTTPSAAVIAAMTGSAATDVTGRGTGIDDKMLAHKIEVVATALERAAPDLSDPIGVLGELGGLEIGAIAGLCLGGAANRLPVVVDGVITLAGAVVACGLAPAALGYLIAGHRSVEPAASKALEHLDLDPLLDLDLRLGEGTGAALAYPLIRAAGRLPNEMATFAQAGVEGG